MLGYRRHLSHVFHAVTTLVTAGLWALLVRLAMAAARREDRVLLEVGRWGDVWATRAQPA